MEKTSDILKRTKAVLLSRGWFQGDYVNPITGEVCIVGAMNIAKEGIPFPDDDDDDEPDPAHDLVSNLCFKEWCEDIGQWNDMHGRTPEQVLALMDRAIALAESLEVLPARDAVPDRPTAHRTAPRA